MKWLWRSIVRLWLGFFPPDVPAITDGSTGGPVPPLHSSPDPFSARFRDEDRISDFMRRVDNHDPDP